MDALTITTGIITILQATTALITVCYNFRAVLKNKPWSLTNLINELRALRSILERLEELAQDLNDPQRSGQSARFALLSDPDNGPLVVCQRELSFLEKKINPSAYARSNNSKRKAVLQALRWQLKDREAKECLERIERCKILLSLALENDQA